MAGGASLNILVAAAKACTLCAPQLRQAPRPVFRVGARARIVTVGQAPDAKMHEPGVPRQAASPQRG